MAASRPSMVSGYMRPARSWRTSRIEAVRLPLGLRHRIEPYASRISGDDALHPDAPGFLVEVLDRAARRNDLIRRHRCVADKDHFVVVRISVQHVPGRRGLGPAPGIQTFSYKQLWKYR